MHNLNSIREHWIRLLMGQPYLPHWPLALTELHLQFRSGLCFLLHVRAASTSGFQTPSSSDLPSVPFGCQVFLHPSLPLSFSLTHSHSKSMPSSHKHSANSCLSCLWSWPRTELREAGLWISIPAAVPRTHASPRAYSVPRVTPYQMLTSSYPSPHPLGITTTSVHRN